MAKTEIGTLEQVSVRSVWPKEAGDFTPWLGGERRLRVEAYIDTGEADSTAEVYSYLESRRGEIEEAFGEALEWSPLEKRRASRVSSYFPKPFGFEDEDLWPEAQEWTVPTLGRLRAAIDPVLDDLYGS